MTHYVVRTGRIVEAPIDVVWDMVADARSYRTWTAMTASTLEREGDDTPDGVGAIRNFGTGNVLSREEVVAFEPPTHLGYVLLAGLPIENYRADVRLVPLGPRSCRVTWVGEFDCRRPTGFVMTRFLRFVLGDFCRRLAKHAPRRA
jgi:uncharacterized protein YndB with AHSA1/START domain